MIKGAMINKLLDKLLPKHLTWWKLVMFQLSGIILVILMIALGLDKPFAFIVGHKNDDTLGWLFIISIVLPIFIGRYRKIKGWRVLALIWMSIFVLLTISFIIMLFKLTK